MDKYLHLGDCIEYMKGLPPASVDLIVSDPPYLMDYKSNRRVVKEKFDKILNDVDSHGLISEYLEQCERILKNDTAIYIFCSWHNIDFFKTEFEKHFKLKNIIVWNKNNHGSGDLRGAYAPKHEFILFGHKGRSLFREKRIPDVIDFAKVDSSKLVHPTEKPVGLLEIFIRNSSDPEDIVFDGFMGGGSTGIAALKNGRCFIGCELDPNFYAVAADRIGDVTG